MSTLTKSKGNMYDWVTHTHTHLRGECPHGCKYCYVQAMERRYNGGHYKGELRLDADSLKVNYGSGKTIFIDNCNDLFAKDVNEEWILAVLNQCCKYPINVYVFQSKDPYRMFAFEGQMPANRIMGTTVESDMFHEGMYSKETPPYSCTERLLAMTEREYCKTFITVEPILKMRDPVAFARAIANCEAAFVNIGADSKGTGLPEPTAKAMLDMNEQSKRQRVDHKKEYYVKECGRLENECAQLKKELSEIKGRRKTSIWQRMYEHAQERMKV